MTSYFEISISGVILVSIDDRWSRLGLGSAGLRAIVIEFFLKTSMSAFLTVGMVEVGSRHWLVRMEWRLAGWSVCLPLLIFPCTIKSRSFLLAPADVDGLGKRAIKWLVKLLWCGMVIWIYIFLRLGYRNKIFFFFSFFPRIISSNTCTLVLQETNIWDFWSRLFMRDALPVAKPTVSKHWRCSCLTALWLI